VLAEREEVSDSEELSLELTLGDPVSDPEPELDTLAEIDAYETLDNPLMLGLTVPLLEWVAVGGGLLIDTEFVCVVVSVEELVPLKVLLAEKLCETQAEAVFVAELVPVTVVETRPLLVIMPLNE
jgi:hypothetical protein